MGFRIAVPLSHFALLPCQVFIRMTLLTGVLDAERIIECGPGNGDRVIRSRKGDVQADAMMLQERHVTSRTQVAWRIRQVIRMRSRREGFARMTSGALGVVKLACQWSSEHVPILH